MSSATAGQMPAEAVETVGEFVASHAALLPAELIAVTIAQAQIQRGDNPQINVTTALLLAVERLAAAAPLIAADRSAENDRLREEMAVLTSANRTFAQQVARLTAELNGARARIEVVYEATLGHQNDAGQVDGAMIRRLLKGLDPGGPQ